MQHRLRSTGEEEARPDDWSDGGGEANYKLSNG